MVHLSSPTRCSPTLARRRCQSVLAVAAVLGLASAATVLAAGTPAGASSPNVTDVGRSASGGATPPDTDAEAGRNEPPVAPIPTLEPGARVIVREIGRRRHPGTLEVYSDDIVVIRDPEGELRSFPRSRVVEVTALLPPDTQREMVVFLEDGTVLTGRVIEDGFTRVVLERDGIRVPFARDAIASTRLLPTFAEELAHRRAAMNPDDSMDWTLLCSWLVEQERWELAAEETERLLEQHPRAREADRLRRVALGQLALAATRAASRAGAASDPGQSPGADAGDASTLPAEPDPADTGDPFERGRLTAQEVNTIRVFEIDFADPPRVSVSRDLVRRIVREHGDSPLLPADDRQRERLHQVDAIDLVRLIFELRARDLYPRIQVLTEPAALKLYRRAAHDSWLINSCGVCHAEPGVGGFRLHVREPRSAETAMTNLLILERLPVSANGPPLIDWDDPSSSRIIQYGLPRFRARFPHPDVPGFRPAFRDLQDRRVEQSLRWIRSMYRPRPEYPVTFDPEALIRAADEAAADQSSSSPGAAESADRDGGEAGDAGDPPRSVGR